MPHLPVLAAPRSGVGGSLLCSVKLCHLLHLSGDQHWRACCRQSFFFLMQQDQAQDVTLVSGTGDRGEKCLGKQGRNNRSFHVPGGGKVREQKRKEKRKETKMENCVKKKKWDWISRYASSITPWALTRQQPSKTRAPGPPGY